MNNVMRFGLLPVVLIVAGLFGQAAMAGGSAVGQSSGATVAGSATIAPPTMSALVALVMGGSGATVRTSSVTTDGVSTTTRTAIVPAARVSATLTAVGLAAPADGTTT